jgi:hypothetical protein
MVHQPPMIVSNMSCIKIITGLSGVKKYLALVFNFELINKAKFYLNIFGSNINELITVLKKHYCLRAHSVFALYWPCKEEFL